MKTKIDMLRQLDRARYTSGQKALTMTQSYELLNNITDLEEKTLIALALTTGIRRSDIVAIKTADVNLKKGVILFYESKKKRIKKVPLDKTVINLLSMWMRINKSKWLFPPKFKLSPNHLASKTAYNIFQRACEKTGISTPRPFHALRATCVKLCQKKGWSIAKTAELLGDTVNVVEKHYATPSDEEMASEMEEKPLL